MKHYILFLLISLFCNISVNSCDSVSSTLDSGTGSLRTIINCVSDGDTVIFENELFGDTIFLLSPIDINKNIVISSGNNAINIQAFEEAPAFIIANGVEVVFIGFTIIGSKVSDGSAILNNGTLQLNKITINDAGYGAIDAVIYNSNTANLTIRDSCWVENAPLKGIIFETNFNENDAYCVAYLGLWNGGSNNPTAPLDGWSGVFATGSSMIEIRNGEGVDGSKALKLSWADNISQPTVSLGKHLTNDVSTGFDELYIRYHVKLPNNFKAGNGSYIPYWKWGRLWQNTTIDTFSNGLITGNWTENRVDSKYVVWNFGGNPPYTDANIVWGANEGVNLHLGSAGGERIGTDYFVSGSVPETSLGYFESIWDINTSDRPGELENNTNQQWHTIEYRFKLASAIGADDGVFEMWWDGVPQGTYTRIAGLGGAPTPMGIPTVVDGSGFNFLVFFDNLTGWNGDWANSNFEGYILVNDVVVSTMRIGHNYIAGNNY
ncbi:MAG: hypothetical protein V3V14_05750 [Saprospiraceae bacterium]